MNHFLPLKVCFCILFFAIFCFVASAQESENIFEHKFPSFRLNNMPKDAEKESGFCDLIVEHAPNVAASVLESSFKPLNARILERYEVFNTLKIRVPIKNINNILSLSFVLFADYDAQEKTLHNNPGREHSRSNYLQESSLNLTGKGVSIAQFDGGVVGAHIDFRDRVTNVDNLGLSGFARNHANWVAGGIIGAGLQDPFTKGTAPDAQLIAHSISHDGYIPYRMYRAKQRYGVTITQNSYGYSAQSLGSCNVGAPYLLDFRHHDALTYMFPELLNVFAVGNSRDNCGAYGSTDGNVGKNGLAVGAVYASENIYFESSWGPSQDGRLKPEVVATGGGVRSTLQPNIYSNNLNGTSFAAPLVSGLAAQLTERYHQLNGGTNPSAALLKALICNGARDLGTINPDYQHGFGRINALNSVRMLNDNRYLNNTINHGQTKTFTVPVGVGAKRLRVMLVWTDPAAAAYANPTLVNNLNLRVIDNTSTTWLPWILNPASPATAATRGVDNRNNIEQVTIDNPSGTYTVEVNGANVASGGTQAYSIVWQIDNQYIEITYPNGNEKVGAGQTGTIYWDAEGITGTFEVEFFNGTAWSTIATGVANDIRFYTLTFASIATSKARFRVKSGMISDDSDNDFTVIGIPSFNVLTAGNNQIFASWSAAIGAETYDVLTFNPSNPLAQWQVAATGVTATSYTITGLQNAQSYWVAIRAVKTTGETVVGERGNPLERTPTGIGQPNDLEMNTISLPALLSCAAFTNAESVSITLRNTGTATIPLGTVIPLAYRVNNGVWVTQNLTLIANLLANTNIIHTFSTKANLLNTGYYTIETRSNWTGDALADNNSKIKLVENKSPLSINVSQSAPLTSCSSTPLLTANNVPFNDYVVSTVAFSPENMTGATAITLGDSDVSAAIPMGFNFNFYNDTHTQFYIAANGVIGFEPQGYFYENFGYLSGVTYYQTPYINGTEAPYNMIAGAATDLDPSAGGTIRYLLKGTAPNRKMIVEFLNVRYYGVAQTVTFQIILYENSNFIEIHSTNIQAPANYRHTMGVKSKNGDFGTAVSGRDGTSGWTAINEGLRFTPTQLALQWFKNGTFTGNTNLTHLSNGMGLYEARYAYNGCTFKAPKTLDCSHLIVPTVFFPPPQTTPPPQTITFDFIPDKMVDDLPFEIFARASSNLPIRFWTRTANVEIIYKNGKPFVKINGAGWVTIIAEQDGDGRTAAPARAFRNFYVNKAKQIIDFQTIGNKAWNENSFPLLATSTAKLPIQFKLIAGDAVLNGNQLSLNKKLGTVTVLAFQSGNENYEYAESSQTFEVIKASQIIDFQSISNVVFNFNEIMLNAVATSGLTVVFEIALGNGEIAANKLKIKVAGNVTVRALQNGDSWYFAAPSVLQSVEVKKSPQTIQFQAVGIKKWSELPLTLLASASSNLAVNFRIIDGKGSVVGNVFQTETHGVVLVEAFQNGNDNYEAAPPVQQRFQVLPPPPSIQFTKTNQNQFCGTDQIAIDFTTDGFFNENNTFYGVLSDPNGNFEREIRLGLPVSKGQITATIPNALPESANYLIKIISSEPRTESNTKTVFISPLPPKPAIFVSATALSSTANEGNQWLRNGVAVSGATAQRFEPTTSGIYAVRVGSRCTQTSENVAFMTTITANEDEQFAPLDLRVFPNPSAHSFRIEVDQSEKIKAFVSDLLGKVLIQFEIEKQKDINLSNYLSGTYLLHLQGKNWKTVRKLILQK